jgi:hypothetical protein
MDGVIVGVGVTLVLILGVGVILILGVILGVTEIVGVTEGEGTGISSVVFALHG